MEPVLPPIVFMYTVFNMALLTHAQIVLFAQMTKQSSACQKKTLRASLRLCEGWVRKRTPQLVCFNRYVTLLLIANHAPYNRAPSICPILDVWVVRVLVGNARKSMNKRSALYVQLQQDCAHYRESEGTCVKYGHELDAAEVEQLPEDWVAHLRASEGEIKSTPFFPRA